MRAKMQKLIWNLFYKYCFLTKALFFVFFFGVLSFGRAFSVIHINISHFPIFITELFLLFLSPLLLIYVKDLFKFPKIFLTASIIYFLFGIIYLFVGALKVNLFAFRDFIVLCGYMLFLPVSFICLRKQQSIKFFIFIIVAANIIAIFIGRMFVSGLNIFWLRDFISQTKTYQIGMIYGITSIFLTVFYNYFRNRFVKLFILGLTAVNLYMLVILGVRSLWVAVVCLAIFLMLVLGFKSMFKVYLKVFVAFTIIGVILFYADFNLFSLSRLDMLVGKVKGTICFLNKNDKVTLGNTAERMGYDNLVWRKKIWEQTINYMASSYLLGKGFGRYPKYKIWGHHEQFTPFENSNIIPIHNHLITLFYKMGFIGFALFLFINIYVFYYALKYVRQSKNIFTILVIKSTLGVLLFWHITALFFDVIDSPPTSILLWIFIGLVFAAVNIDKKQEGKV